MDGCWLQRAGMLEGVVHARCDVIGWKDDRRNRGGAGDRARGAGGDRPGGAGGGRRS